MTTPIAIVIPTLDEQLELPRTLSALCAVAEPLEIVVVDGGSRDDTRGIARRYGVRVVESAPGRAIQMNRGADASSGDPVVFLHADTRLESAHFAAIRRTLVDPAAVYGSFAIRLEHPKRSVRTIARLANLRTRLDRTPYGDQAMFVRRAAFESVGGFPLVPIMEDVMLGRALRSVGRYVFISSHPVWTSSRRWQRDGIMATSLRNLTTRVLWELGMSPSLLRELYDRRAEHAASAVATPYREIEPGEGGR